MEEHYTALVQRNWGFIPERTQSRLANMRVLLAGCGLGSNIAVMAARTGITRFVLCDGDQVEESNLNRQAFRLEHVGRNKAEATAELVREINPDARIEVTAAYIQPEQARALVHESDVVVNMVDPGPALTALLNEAREHGKTTLFPLNVGFGGVLLAFGPTSPRIPDFEEASHGPDSFLRTLLELAPLLPNYLSDHKWIADKIVGEGAPVPQLAIAVSVSAALVVAHLVKLAQGKEIPLVPNVITLDTWTPSVFGGQFGSGPDGRNVNGVLAP